MQFENFYEYFSYLRKEKKVSLQEVASETGITAGYLSRLENGDRKSPSFILMVALADKLGGDINELIANVMHKTPINHPPKETVELDLLLARYKLTSEQAVKLLEESINYNKRLNNIVA